MCCKQLFLLRWLQKLLNCLKWLILYKIRAIVFWLFMVCFYCWVRWRLKWWWLEIWVRLLRLSNFVVFFSFCCYWVFIMFLCCMMVFIIIFRFFFFWEIKLRIFCNFVFVCCCFRILFLSLILVLFSNDLIMFLCLAIVVKVMWRLLFFCCN